MSNAKNTIFIKNYSNVIEEYVANGTIMPGHLLSFATATLEVKANAAAAVAGAPLMVAVENALVGSDIDTAYVKGDKVQVWIPYRGDEVYVVLHDGETIVKGDLIAAYSDGTVKKVSSNVAVAVALEALDLSASDSSAAGIQDQSGALGYNKRLIVKII